MLQNDRMAFNSSHSDNEMVNKRAWRFHAAICSKINTNPTSKNMFFKAYGGALKGASSPSKTILPLWHTGQTEKFLPVSTTSICTQFNPLNFDL
jgi:hypothetical protein